jgi:hypothetical protein
MRRIGLAVVLAVLVAPVLSDAQQSTKVPRIGFLGAVPPSSPGIQAFEARLRELGYLNGQNIAIEFRTSAGNSNALPDLAAELVRLNVDVLVAGGSEGTVRAALETEALKKSDTELHVNVTRCQYAEFFKGLGLPELGYLLSCNRDFAMVESFDPRIALRRTQTIMEGASHCDFRFVRKE